LTILPGTAGTRWFPKLPSKAREDRFILPPEAGPCRRRAKSNAGGGRDPFRPGATPRKGGPGESARTGFSGAGRIDFGGLGTARPGAGDRRGKAAGICRESAGNRRATHIITRPKSVI